MAKQLIGKAALTQVRTTTSRIVLVGKGKPAPADMSAEDRKRLIEEGYLVEVDVAEEETETGPTPGSAAFILAEVGDDKALAQVALDEENAKEKPRKGLLADLEKVLSA